MLRAAAEVNALNENRLSLTGMKILEETERKIPSLKAVIAIKSSPSLHLLRDFKKEVSWATLCREATVDDLEALRVVLRNKNLTQRAKAMVENTIEKLECLRAV